jgi:hypothetical protein
VNGEIPVDAPKTRDAIVQLLSRGHWYTEEEVSGYLLISCKRMVSGSACTARIRELKKPRYGGHNVQGHPRAGSKAYEYRIERQESKAA